ncbi:DgyrCDS3374 [Dimorphilus gyrociliatus]|uniref:DgyrCDS3374 n=1 Tax=Dimorphilus gyrociliatus TaxID=2664684 RepID=A0A7I8VD08_9ANNE|nr:DgyrCDS3374 [Dimorphilus gyrociliatus]
MNPVIPPKPDAYSQPLPRSSRISAPPVLEKERNHPLTPERRKPPPLPPRESRSDECSVKENILLTELEETRTRANQMEKTMKWWADCTNQWRSKWSRKHSDYKKLKDDYKKLRARYEAVTKDNKFKQDLSNSSVNVLNTSTGRSLHKDEENVDRISKSSLKSLEDLPTDPKPETTSPSHRSRSRESRTDSSKSSSKSEFSDKKNSNDDFSQLKVKLDQAERLLEADQREKEILTTTISTLQKDLIALKKKYEDLKHNNQKTNIDKFSETSTDNESDLQKTEEKINILREQLVAAQKESADEYSKRERLESEKIAIERKNKQLLNDVSALEESLQRRISLSENHDKQIQSLTEELNTKAKDNAQLKHSNSKLKSSLQEKKQDLEHSNKRAEQYETEVKHLRLRVDELKIELSQSQSDVCKTKYSYIKLILSLILG